MSTSHFTSVEGARTPLSGTQPQDMDADGGRSVLAGESLAVRHLRSQIQRIAPHFRIALIRGEAGSGKQLAARAIHALSSAAGAPFVITEAAALAEAVQESPLPSLSLAGKPLWDAARGGTLYVNCVGELSFAQQDILLRFLRERLERRAAPGHGVHSKVDRRDASRIADTRILASSDSDLRTLAAVGHFRQDLYAQLSAVEIFVPPLRQRVEDIPLLAASLLRWHAQQTGQPAKRLADATAAHLCGRAWPGNLRELDGVVAQAAALAEGEWIEPRHLMTLVEPRVDKTEPPIKIERLQEVVERHVVDVLTRCGGNKLRAAELLGISRSTLYRMLGARADAEGHRTK